MTRAMTDIRPRALALGDTIAIVAPSGAVDPALLDSGKALLRRLGFQARTDPAITARRGYLAGDSDRAAALALSAAFSDPEIDGIICAKGGYGALRILPFMDWDTVRAHPKFFCGFSDITALHHALRREAGMVTFHGPMALLLAEERQLDWNERGLLEAMTSTKPLGTIALPADGPPIETLVRGSAEGVLDGGNLSLLASLCGTRWQPRLQGRILLLEDVHEAPYRVDRMLTQLRLAGVLEGIAGVLFGDSPTCDRPPSARGRTLREVIMDRLGDLGVPVVYGFPCGHGDYRATLPLGVRARLDANAGTLTLLEAAAVLRT